MTPTAILFLPGTGLPHQFYQPLMNYLGRFGRVHRQHYRHEESMAAACKRCGGSVELFKKLRSEVCSGAASFPESLLGLKPGDSITDEHERLHKNEKPQSLWRRTIVVGHSQGAGHALMLSQMHELAGVIMMAGPADAINGSLATWPRASYQTPLTRRLMLIHQQDGGRKAILEHAVGSGMRVHVRNKDMPELVGGHAILEKYPVPTLAAHGCLASGLIWAPESTLYEHYDGLLKRHIVEWQINRS